MGWQEGAARDRELIHSFLGSLYSRLCVALGIQSQIAVPRSSRGRTSQRIAGAQIDVCIGPGEGTTDFFLMVQSVNQGLEMGWMVKDECEMMSSFAFLGQEVHQKERRWSRQ